MRASVSDANRRVEMLNLRGEACERRIGTCADILRSELGLAPDAEINPDAILAKGGEAARQRKKTAEELSLAQTEVKRLRDKVARARKELTNPNFKSRASLLDVDRQVCVVATVVTQKLCVLPHFIVRCIGLRAPLTYDGTCLTTRRSKTWS